jgi:hypothetical protein
MAFGGAKSWENWDPVIGEGDADPHVAWGDDGPDHIDYDNLSVADATEMFQDLLISLKLSGNINATQCCNLAFFAHKAGCPGTVLKQLAVKPSSQSGRFSRVFDKVVGSAPKDAGLYDVGMGLRLRHEASRRFDYIATLPPHEALHNEFVASGYLVTELRKAKSNAELPPLYWDHPVVKAAPRDVDIHPLCIYVDAVTFGRGESCLAFWVYFLFSKTRHLVAVLRKSELCSCGCKGWCTIHPVWSMLSWSIQALQSSTYPAARHDGAPWRDSDSMRSPMAGEPFGFASCCLFLKGDWGEFGRGLPMPYVFRGPGQHVRCKRLVPTWNSWCAEGFALV